MSVNVEVKLTEELYEDLREAKKLIGAKDLEEVFLTGLTLVLLTKKGSLFFKDTESNSFSPIALTTEQKDEVRAVIAGEVSVFNTDDEVED